MTYTEPQVVAMVQRRASADGVRETARRLRVSPTYVVGVCYGTMRPGAKILAGLGLARQVRYVRCAASPLPHGRAK